MGQHQPAKQTLERELERCVRRLVEYYRPERILLFGSLAQGRANEHSDIDLVVVAESAKPFPERIAEAMALLEGPVPVDVFVYTPAEFQRLQRRWFLQHEILARGREVYVRPGARPLARGEPTMPGREDARAWLKRAERDLRAARVALEAALWEHACFLAQQAAEKALKAAWLAQGRVPPRTHDLVALARELPFPTLQEKAEQLRTLSAYYTAARYPDVWTDVETLCPPSQARAAISFAQEVLDIITPLSTDH